MVSNFNLVLYKTILLYSFIIIVKAAQLGIFMVKQCVKLFKLILAFRSGFHTDDEEVFG